MYLTTCITYVGLNFMPSIIRMNKHYIQFNDIFQYICRIEFLSRRFLLTIDCWSRKFLMLIILVTFFASRNQIEGKLSWGGRGVGEPADTSLQDVLQLNRAMYKLKSNRMPARTCVIPASVYIKVTTHFSVA